MPTHSRTVVPTMTCILIFYMYFTRIPKESKIHLGSHQDMYLMRFLDVTHWIEHIRIHQDTCILDSSSRYIKILRDTKSRYKMYLGRVMTTLQDTIRIQSGYMRDTCGIHAGYMNLQTRGSRIHAGYMHDNTCMINQGYMRDKCICSGSRIHEGYM